MYGDEWPLRVTGIASAAESEWRIGQQTPERTCEGWLLVYVKKRHGGRAVRYPPGAAARRADFVPPARRAVCHARGGRSSAGGVPRGIYRGRQCDGFLPQLPYAARQRRKKLSAPAGRNGARGVPAGAGCLPDARPPCGNPVWRQRAANHLSGTAAVPAGPPQAAHPQTKPPCPRRAGAGSPCGKRAPVLCAEH